MSCVPGMPCYTQNVVYSNQCDACKPLTTSDDVYYSASNLPNTGINFKDSLTLALQKIDAEFDPITLASTILATIATNYQTKALFCNLVTSCATFSTTTTSTSTTTSTTTTIPPITTTTSTTSSTTTSTTSTTTSTTSSTTTTSTTSSTTTTSTSTTTSTTTTQPPTTTTTTSTTSTTTSTSTSTTSTTTSTTTTIAPPAFNVSNLSINKSLNPEITITSVTVNGVQATYVSGTPLPNSGSNITYLNTTQSGSCVVVITYNSSQSNKGIKIYFGTGSATCGVTSSGTGQTVTLSDITFNNTSRNNIFTQLNCN